MISIYRYVTLAKYYKKFDLSLHLNISLTEKSKRRLDSHSVYSAKEELIPRIINVVQS